MIKILVMIGCFLWLAQLFVWIKTIISIYICKFKKKEISTDLFFGLLFIPYQHEDNDKKSTFGVKTTLAIYMIATIVYLFLSYAKLI